MRDAVEVSPMIEWAVAAAPLAGESESGDPPLVKPVGRGMLVAAVDGLGHGAEAAAAARAAVAALDRHAEEFVLPLVRRCHAALHGKRGVVLGVAYLDGVKQSMTWLSVGNVEGVLLYTDQTAQPARPARASLLTRGGIVGSELPQLRAEVVPIAAGDILIFATDGIREGFAEDLQPDAGAQQLADEILAHRSEERRVGKECRSRWSPYH